MNTKYTEYMVEKEGVIIINDILIMLKSCKNKFLREAFKKFRQ